MTPLKTAGRGRPDEGKPARWRVYHALMRAKKRAGKTAGVGMALARPDETMVEAAELERGGADQREERGADAHDDERGAADQERERGAVDRGQLDHQPHEETSTRPGETAATSCAKSAAAQETPVEEKNNDAPVDAGCDEKNTAVLPKDGAYDDDMNYGALEESGHEMTEQLKNSAGIDEYKTLAAEIGSSMKSAEARKEINITGMIPLPNGKYDVLEINKRGPADGNEKEQLNGKCIDTAEIGYDQEREKALKTNDDTGDAKLRETGAADSAESGDEAADAARHMVFAIVVVTSDP